MFEDLAGLGRLIERVELARDFDLGPGAGDGAGLGDVFDGAHSGIPVSQRLIA